MIILWWLWFTDVNYSVHTVAHSYISPRQSELKLQEFKVTVMFSFDALSSAQFYFYQTANSPQSDFHCGPGLTHYTVYYERVKQIQKMFNNTQVPLSKALNSQLF